MEKRQVTRRGFLSATVTALAGTALTACQPRMVEKVVKETVPVTVKETVEVVQTAKPVKERKRVRTLWWDNVVPGYREEPMRKWDEVQDEYWFDYDWSPNYYDKLIAMIAGGLPPDLFIIQYQWLAQFLQTGVLLDLQPLVDRDKYSLADFPQFAIDGYRWEGGLYGLPDNITGLCIYYNKDIFDEAGVPYPTNKWDDTKWTIDDFLAACANLQKRDANGKVTQWAFNLQFWSIPIRVWISLFGEAGSWVDDPMEPTKCVLDDPGSIQGLQLYADLRNKYEYAPAPEIGIPRGELLQTGRLAMDIGGGWGVKGWMQYKFPYDIGHFPKGPARRNNYLYYYPICIPKVSKVAEGAWSLLKYYEDVAIKEIIAQGDLQGTKLSDMMDIFAKDREGAASREVLVDSVAHFQLKDPLLTNFAEIERTILAELDPLWLGKKTAEECCMAAKAKVDPMIEKGRF